MSFSQTAPDCELSDVLEGVASHDVESVEWHVRVVQTGGANSASGQIERLQQALALLTQSDFQPRHH